MPSSILILLDFISSRPSRRRWSLSNKSRLGDFCAVLLVAVPSSSLWEGSKMCKALTLESLIGIYFKCPTKFCQQLLWAPIAGSKRFKLLGAESQQEFSTRWTYWIAQPIAHYKFFQKTLKI